MSYAWDLLRVIDMTGNVSVCVKSQSNTKKLIRRKSCVARWLAILLMFDRLCFLAVGPVVDSNRSFEFFKNQFQCDWLMLEKISSSQRVQSFRFDSKTLSSAKSEKGVTSLVSFLVKLFWAWNFFWHFFFSFSRRRRTLISQKLKK